jgi:hypothetical protein
MALFDEALTKRLTDLSALFASLVSGKVPASQLPSYVDDVLEYANFAALPGTGESGKIYVTIDNNKTFRWSGSSYIEISASPGSSDSVTEGSTNLYFTNARALAAAPAETVTTSGALINSATAKTTPVDADTFGVMDSADSNVLKKLSWANIKATLKTYFDTLYSVKASPTFSGIVGNSGSAFIGTDIVTCTTLNVGVTLTGMAGVSGLVTFRDNSRGGSALWLVDPNSGCYLIYSNISDTVTLEELPGTGYALQVKVTAGTVPKNIAWVALLQ